MIRPKFSFFFCLQVGAVNFNILHALLHQMLKETGLNNKAAAPVDTSLLKKGTGAAANPGEGWKF